MSESYTIAPMNREELDLSLEWAAREGWNPGLRDAEAFWAADPEGFLVKRLEGKMVASISMVSYGRDFRFIGLYIVAPELRGQGLGTRLWNEALARFPAETLGLDSVLAQEKNYAASGFATAYHSLRRQSSGGGEADPAVVDLAAIPFARTAAYDAGVFAFPREAFLRRWLTLPGHTALGIQENGALKGYGVLRPCRVGHKIGPLFADDPDIALRLYRSLAARVPGEAVFLDTPLQNAEASELARRLAMGTVFETARMYKGPVAPVDLNRVYGVTSFELG